MEWKLLGLSGFRPDFLSIGVMGATLWEESTVPGEREVVDSIDEWAEAGEAMLDQCRWNGVQWAGCEVDFVEVVSEIGFCND